MFLGFSLANSGRFYESRNGVKYFKLRNGKFVKENSRGYKNAIKLQNQGRTTNESFMPARGRLYYGSKDPEYIRARDLAKANNTDNTLKRASKVTVNQVIDKKWFTEGYKGKKGAKFSRDSVFDNNMDVLQTTALRLEQAVKNGMEDACGAVCSHLVCHGHGDGMGVYREIRVSEGNRTIAVRGRGSDGSILVR